MLRLLENLFLKYFKDCILFIIGNNMLFLIKAMKFEDIPFLPGKHIIIGQTNEKEQVE